ncbi:hypothetical protein KM043_002108 [Ampulex compressa]|nr:hypothetical protein KM043_002108 [Ampulex compressa]
MPSFESPRSRHFSYLEGADKFYPSLLESSVSHEHPQDDASSRRSSRGVGLPGALGARSRKGWPRDQFVEASKLQLLPLCLIYPDQSKQLAESEKRTDRRNRCISVY